MNKRICASCAKNQPEKNFHEISHPKGHYFRRICNACKIQLSNHKKSATPESYLKHLFSQLKYTRKKNSPELGWDIEIQDLLDRWHLQEGRCALSNILMTFAKDGGGRKEFNVSIDRIHPHTGYNPSNIQLVCYRINMMKHTLPEEELYWWCKNIVTNKEDI
jgi:hypothetical protein|tara:strand:+ start:142 stop:627 length:486 start_codon:yes stop_codon:yes gene_type:complete